ncbi:hypothetical protein MRY87_02530 [bacterium]|nr:hypothetical protein [bacterium]
MKTFLLGIMRKLLQHRAVRTEEWKFVSEYNVEEYECGLRAGDYLRARADFPSPEMGEEQCSFSQGELFGVLSGSKDTPGVVWLLRQQGEQRMTWDDDSTIFEVFERIPQGDTSPKS